MFWSLENLRTSEVFGVAKTAANIIIIIFFIPGKSAMMVSELR